MAKTTEITTLRFLSPLHRATRQIASFIDRTQPSRAGLKSNEAHLTSYLLSYAPCSVAELVEVFGFPPSTMTSLLDRLEKKKLISRQTHPEDRRSFMIGLTEKGITAAGGIRAELEKLEERVAKRVKKADIAGFNAVLTAIAGVTRPDKD